MAGPVSPGSGVSLISTGEPVEGRSQGSWHDGPGLNRTESLPIVAQQLTYTWDYQPQRLDLRALYEKSKDLMWNARTLPAWDTKVDCEAENSPDSFLPIFGTPLWDKLDKKRDLPALRRHMGSYLLSNFLHGEQGAMLATAQIV